MSVPVIVNCRDRLQPLRLLVDYLERAGHERIVLLDNDSAYPPLLEYLDATPHRVIRLGVNAGPLAPWTHGVFDTLAVTGPFVYTDPDVVPDETCPLDAIEYFAEILDAYPDRVKVGFGLRIDDLPATYRHRADAERWEAQFWRRRLAPRLFDAAIDSTFALYREPASYALSPAVRTGHPYVARHMSWYLDDAALGDDERFYRSRSNPEIVNWSRDSLPVWLSNAIGDLQPMGPDVSELRLGLDGADSLANAELIAASAWTFEPTPVDEVAYTQWAEPGWHSWNDMSPEVELCEFLATFVRIRHPERVIETGAGQGFVSRRLKAQLASDQRLTCFESDGVWREALRSVPFFDGTQARLSSDTTPSIEDLAQADLTCLDSDVALRLREIERWWDAARPGAVVFVHDAGNGHGPDTFHARVRETIVRLAIPGCFLANPRGAFVGVKPPSASVESGAELATQLEVVSRELDALRNTKTFRYTRRARTLYQSWRRL
jgi:hypothetical protein